MRCSSADCTVTVGNAPRYLCAQRNNLQHERVHRVLIWRLSINFTDHAAVSECGSRRSGGLLVTRPKFEPVTSRIPVPPQRLPHVVPLLAYLRGPPWAKPCSPSHFTDLLRFSFIWFRSLHFLLFRFSSSRYLYHHFLLPSRSKPSLCLTTLLFWFVTPCRLIFNAEHRRRQ